MIYRDLYDIIQPTRHGDVDGNILYDLNIIEPTTNAYLVNLVVIQSD